MRLTSEPCAGSVTINCGMRTLPAFRRFRAWAGGDRGPVPAPGADPVPGAPSPIPDLSRGCLGPPMTRCVRAVRVAPAGQDEQYPWHCPQQRARAVCLAGCGSARTRSVQLRNVLKLQQVTPEQLAAETEAFASTDWRPRSELWRMRVPGWRTAKQAMPPWSGSALRQPALGPQWAATTSRHAMGKHRHFHQRARSLLPGLPNGTSRRPWRNSCRSTLARTAQPSRSRILLRRRTGCGGRRSTTSRR